MTNWLTYSILIPLFPIATAILISFLKGEAIQIQNILGGTDLFILSMVVLATTRSDVESSSPSLFAIDKYRRVATLLVPGMLFCAVVYGIILTNVNSSAPDFPVATIAGLGVCIGLATFGVCSWLQYTLRRATSLQD